MKKLTKLLTLLLTFCLLLLTGCSTTVNEDTWVRAFSKEGLQNCEISIIIDSLGESSFETEKFDGNIMYYCNSSGMEKYIYTDENNLVWEYNFNQKDQTWHKSISNNFGDIRNNTFVNAYGNLYPLFKYDKENKCYTRITDQMIFRVYFKNSKVHKITITSYYVAWSSTTVIEFSNYGKVKLTLPEATSTK